MSDTVDIAWLRDRLVSVAALTETQAGALICKGMVGGELSAVAPHAVCRPENSARYHSDEEFSEDEYLIPSEYWSAVDVDWSDRRPYFRFFHQRRAWLAQQLNVPSKAAFAFLRANDPLRESQPASASNTPATQQPSAAKAQGGRTRTHDWAAAAGALAGHMYIKGEQSHADLTRFVEQWFVAERERQPDHREVERFVTEALRELERIVPRG